MAAYRLRVLEIFDQKWNVEEAWKQYIEENIDTEVYKDATSGDMGILKK